MSVKMTGAEFNAFMDSDVWQDGDYIEDEDIVIDGHNCGDAWSEALLAPDSAIEIKSGRVYRDGSMISDLLDLARRWSKSQKVSTLVVECPKALEEKIRKVILENGGTIR